jgi:hypothetical protein
MIVDSGGRDLSYAKEKEKLGGIERVPGSGAEISMSVPIDVDRVAAAKQSNSPLKTD